MDRLMVVRIANCAACGRTHTVQVHTARIPRLYRIRGELVWHDYTFRCKRTRRLVPLALDPAGFFRPFSAFRTE